jgi:DNA topoisomerase-1
LRRRVRTDGRDASRSRTTTEERAAAAARAAHLRYAAPRRPGIRRLRAGRGFRYVRPDGSPVRDAATLDRIRELAIPPAYRDVWISPDPRGHLQATGRDARGRLQYRYHARWRAVRDATKFDRMLAFSRWLPRIRRRVARDLRRPGLPREKVVAAVVQLLERTWVRVGNERYAKGNRSYGLTTLRDRHVSIGGNCIFLQFRAKGGKLHRCQVCDGRLARIVARCKDLPGEELFQYRTSTDAVGPSTRTTSTPTCERSPARTSRRRTSARGPGRCWPPTRCSMVRRGRRPANADRKRAVVAALDRVAEQLDNTRAVSRKYYVHPRLIESFERGTLAPELRRSRAQAASGRSAEERALAAFLGRRRR